MTKMHLQCDVVYWPALAIDSTVQLSAAHCLNKWTNSFVLKVVICMVHHISKHLGLHIHTNLQ